MAQCILCLKELEKLTEEHVFPAVLGGALSIKDATCQKCNNGFSPLEQRFAARFAHFRRIFGIPNRDGELPNVSIAMNIEGRNLEGKLQPDGTFRMVPTLLKNEQGKAVEVVHEVSTPLRSEELRAQLKHGWELVEEKVPAREAQISMAGNLDFFDSDESLRVAAKIAFSALAYRFGNTFARSGSFQELRNFIQTGDGKGIVRLFLNERFLAEAQQGPHQHSVIIVGRRDHKAVNAIVRLFGGLCYFVRLSDRYDGVDFSNSLVIDASRGEENLLLVSQLDTEFHQIELVRSAPDTIWDDQQAAGRSFLKIIEHAIEKATHKDQQNAH